MSRVWHKAWHLANGQLVLAVSLFRGRNICLCYLMGVVWKSHGRKGLPPWNHAYVFSERSSKSYHSSLQHRSKVHFILPNFLRPWNVAKLGHSFLVQTFRSSWQPQGQVGLCVWPLAHMHTKMCYLREVTLSSMTYCVTLGELFYLSWCLFPHLCVGYSHYTHDYMLVRIKGEKASKTIRWRKACVSCCLCATLSNSLFCLAVVIL